MKGFVIACAAFCGIAAGVALSYGGAAVYADAQPSVRSAPASPFATHLIGSVVGIDTIGKKITIRVVSPYDSSPYAAAFAYDTETEFRIANEPGILGDAGIAKYHFSAGTKVLATVLRAPGTLHLDALFASDDL